MAKPPYIELAGGVVIAILYEDRSILAIDKPADWMLAPGSWQRTSRNLQAALVAGVRTREFWARSRNLRFLRYIHRLDAETTGVLLLGKSAGVVSALGRLFETRAVEKTYLAVVEGIPKEGHWTCRAKLGPDPAMKGRMKSDPRDGKEAETEFHVVASQNRKSLIEARPRTGRTHQIRVHLLLSGHPVVGDVLYNPHARSESEPFGLRAIALSYTNPFTRKPVSIHASVAQFLEQFGFEEATTGAEGN